MRVRRGLASVLTGIVMTTAGAATAASAAVGDPSPPPTGQVTEVPAGGADAGGGVLQIADTAGVIGLGVAGMLLGAGLLVLPGARRRRGIRI